MENQKFTKYQQKVIKNYYENREAIGLQRLSELVTELYLAEGKARQKTWKQITAALEKLKIPPSRIEHLVRQDNPSLVAKLVVTGATREIALRRMMRRISLVTRWALPRRRIAPDPPGWL